MGSRLQFQATSDPPGGQNLENEFVDNEGGNSQLPFALPFYPPEALEPGQAVLNPNESLQLIHMFGRPGSFANDGGPGNSLEPTAAAIDFPAPAQNSGNASNILLQNASTFDETVFVNHDPALAKAPAALSLPLSNDFNVGIAGPGGSTLLTSNLTTGSTREDGLPVHFSNTSNSMLHEQQHAMPGGHALDQSEAFAFGTPPLPAQNEQQSPPQPDLTAGGNYIQQQQLMIDSVSRENEILRQQLTLLQAQSYQQTLMMMAGQQQPPLPFLLTAGMQSPNLLPPLSLNASMQAATSLASTSAAQEAAKVATPATVTRQTSASSGEGGQADPDSGTDSQEGTAGDLSMMPSLQQEPAYHGRCKPRRPLSAYNLFFKDERIRLLEQIDAGDPWQPPTVASIANEPYRRRRRVGFEQMGREIGRRWKRIDPQRKSHYQQRAAAEKARYEHHLAIFKKKAKTSAKTSTKHSQQQDEQQEEEEGAVMET